MNTPKTIEEKIKECNENGTHLHLNYPRKPKKDEIIRITAEDRSSVLFINYTITFTKHKK